MPSGLMWDNFPSSYMGTTLFNLDRPTGPAGIPVIGSLDWKVTKANSFPFIPTSSTLYWRGNADFNHSYVHFRT